MTRATAFPEGVHGIRLQTLRSRAAGLGVYVFRAGPWLIDAGFRNARRQLLAWPELAKADACLLTHHDEDHVGNAAALSERGLAVMARPQVIEAIERAGRLPLYRRWIWGMAEPGRVMPAADALDAAGWRLVPVHTPGHSADHFIFHEPQRELVFSGDLYISRRVKVAKPDEDPALLVASLETVLELEPQVMYCAHRGRIDRPAEALRSKVEWIEELIHRARELDRLGLEAGEITRRLLGREGPIRYFSGGEYTKRNLIVGALNARP